MTAEHGAASDGRPAPVSGSDKARRRIMDASIALFAAHGFDGTSTARIARTANVPKGLLFYYFPAKSDILSAVLAERAGGADIDPGTVAVPGDPVQALLNVGEGILENHKASEVLREIIWHESHTRADVHDALTHYRQAMHATIEATLAASLVSAREDAVRAAADAWGAVVTARPLDTGENSTLHESQNLRAIAELLCAGLRAEPTTADQ